MRIWLKRLAYVVGGLVGLAVIAAVSIYAISEHRLNKTYAVAEETIPVADDSATIARGEHIADAIAGCGDCHGPGLRGQAVFDSPRMG
ncbi:MAG TPA: hypothetical protein VHV78_13685, partial [Gemmatimonadaceae bacterium]|nr:hypothetical protein [Gemmatimonadaceae bacterium]